jgi:hypothetical protein
VVLLTTSLDDGGDAALLLTVEEAARVLRIGRTKAYALTREYRQTGGRSGLAVVDFGDVLRVPASRIAATLGVTVPEVIAAVRGSRLSAALLSASDSLLAGPDRRARPRTPPRQPTSPSQLSLLDTDGPPSIR